MKPRFELAEIISRFEHSYSLQYHPNTYQQNILYAVRNCRTSALGGHIDRCDHCGIERISYNSCRNRHCPKCQHTNREMWIGKIADLLPEGKYFHIVFTVPESLNGLFIAYRDDMQNILFRAAWQTIEAFAADSRYLGAQSGMVAVLHTWGQTLTLHPHLHCIVPEAGVDCKSQWIKGKYVDHATPVLFPVRQMAKTFRGKFLSMTSGMLKNKYKQKAPTIKEKVFNVYAQPPYNGLQGVIRYLGRYTHKTAIGNHRIENISDRGVTFSYKDYKDGNTQKTMTLSGLEFLRRFMLHVQNKGFRRIRNCGIFASSNRDLLNEIRVENHQEPVKKLTKKEWKEFVYEKLVHNPEICPVCKIGKMLIIRFFDMPRPPPVNKQLLCG